MVHVKRATGYHLTPFRIVIVKQKMRGNSWVVQWLRFFALTAEGLGLTPGWELGSHRPCGSAKKKKKKISVCEDVKKLNPL